MVEVEQDGTVDLSARRAAEQALIRRVKSGDSAAFRCIVESHQDMIYRIVLRQVRNTATAEELTQEVFIRAYRGLARFRFEAQLSTWLVRIAINLTRSFLGSRRHRQAQRTDSLYSELKGIGEAPAPGEDNPERCFEQQELMRRFQGAFELLKPKLKEVVGLVGLEGLSYQEAAEVLRVPVGTVRSRLNKARLVLRESFSEFAGGG